ncbi:unnamed protein product [Adineta steineri]|uniref:Tetratricopeptide repeat protein n=1 Tax=Adineta steineri TaxID=433720 RepID=A0A815W6S9_9BILA|nr:unnamed protein product [Adineta steineri]CAF1538214.1 unnamed protein product [Adineta steineri]
MLPCLPCDNPSFMNCISSLARLQTSVDLINEAQINYEKLLDIYLQNPEQSFSEIAAIYNTLSEINIEKQKDYTLGLYYKQKEFEFELKYMTMKPDRTEAAIDLDNQKIGKMYEELANIYVQLCEYDFARDNFKLSIQFWEYTNSYRSNEQITIATKKLKDLARISKNM